MTAELGGAVFFFHNAKTRAAMENNFHKVLLPAIQEGLTEKAKEKGGGEESLPPLRGGALYLDGNLLSEDPEDCGFAGYCHEY